MKSIPRAFFVWQGLIALAVATGFALSYRGWQWDWVRSEIRRAHPQLQQVPPADLARWLGTGSPRPLLLDVRSRPEFDVSHIPYAQWIAPGSVPTDLSLPADKDAPIVLYCNTGRRSCELAERLQSAGYTRVWLLDGGLFRWANEDRILTGAHGPATTVHPQNHAVQNLLKRERRATEAVPVP